MPYGSRKKVNTQEYFWGRGSGAAVFARRSATMIIIYTGNGKGKTSASVGQCVRALGQGMRVVFAQFMKRDGQAGEQIMLKRLLGEDFLAGGAGFFRREEERPQHREAALRVLDWARERLPGAAMLVLDESLYALRSGLLERAELEDLLAAAREAGCHVVLSGRDAPAWLAEAADIVSRVDEVRHAWRAGEPARKGIEF